MFRTPERDKLKPATPIDIDLTVAHAYEVKSPMPGMLPKITDALARSDVNCDPVKPFSGTPIHPLDRTPVPKGQMPIEPLPANPLAFATAFNGVNGNCFSIDLMKHWFAQAIEAGAMAEAKARTKREREERHVQSIITRWREDEKANKLRFVSTTREEEERLVKALVDGWSAKPE